MRLAVKVRPSSGRAAVTEAADGSLIVFVKSAPENGRANDELVKVLARHFGVTIADVRVVNGATSRKKLVEVHGAVG